jgi:phage repressor protein C with HTH and peptisase S24 domain
MAPTLRHGDAVLVRGGGRRGYRPGDIVVAVFRSRPELLVIKRLIRPAGDGWWLGRVTFRYWPRPTLFRR